MACGTCGKRKLNRARYKYTAPDGTVKILSSKTEAQYKVKLKGGKYEQA